MLNLLTVQIIEKCHPYLLATTEALVGELH